MNKFITFFAILLVFSLSLEAQEGDNRLLMNIEGGIGANHGDLGKGIIVKVLYGTGRSAQLSLTTVVASFNSQNTNSKLEVHTGLFNFLVGYRQNFNGLFVEPQLGVGQQTGKITLGNSFTKPTTIAGFGAIDLGYTMDRLNFGMRFTFSHGIQQKNSSIWYNRDYNYGGFFIGYALFVNKTPSQ